MKKIILPILIITFSIILSSCVSVDTIRLSTAPENLTPIPTEQVKIYSSANSVPCEYAEVAIISTQGSNSKMGNDKLVKNAREEAGQIGANAIIISRFSEVETKNGSEPTAKILAIFEKRPCN